MKSANQIEDEQQSAEDESWWLWIASIFWRSMLEVRTGHFPYPCRAAKEAGSAFIPCILHVRTAMRGVVSAAYS